MIISGAGFSLGMFVLHGGYPSGVQLLAWLVLLLVIAIPVVVLELGTGTIYQDSLAGSSRKAAKWGEFFGWGSAVVAFIGLLFMTNLSGYFAYHAWDNALSALGNQPNKWMAHGASLIAERESNYVLSLALILALLPMSLWRGAPFIARLSVAFGVLGMLGLCVILMLLLMRPGAMSGLAQLFDPTFYGWHSLIALDTWGFAAGLVALSFACGCGVFTAYGSYLNRSGDAIGLGVSTVFLAGCVQLMIIVIFALGQTLDYSAQVVSKELPVSPVLAVASVIAHGGWPAWSSSFFVSVWFTVLSVFTMMTMLGLLEAVISPLVDKFRLGRERVIPALCLCVFFLCSFTNEKKLFFLSEETSWHALILLAAIGHMLVAWRALKYEAIARHLNAYSAFHLGVSWYACVLVLVPFFYLLALAWMVERDDYRWLIMATWIIMTCIMAFFTTRLKGKGV
jgi:SNF family Na+-dependent transporter